MKRGLAALKARLASRRWLDKFFWRKIYETRRCRSQKPALLRGGGWINFSGEKFMKRGLAALKSPLRFARRSFFCLSRTILEQNRHLRIHEKINAQF